MNFEYTLKIGLPLEQAWTTLMDLETIAPCMPGATIESHDGDNYIGRLKVKLGPMEMTYRGNIHFRERDDTAKIAVVDAQAKEIKGRGNAKTEVTLRGTAVDDGTEITLFSEFTVSGKAAQFGRGVMEEVGEKLMGDFAQRLATQIGATNDSASESASAEPIAEVPTNAPASPDQDIDEVAELSSENEALDLGGAAWWPVLKRLALPAAVTIVALLYFAK
jgi:carbon monoxide dehydrogenase subunit G